MGHEIPVFFGVVDHELPANQLSNWNDALTPLYDERSYSATSHNWYHLYIIEEICADFGIIGLKFLRDEVACICGNALDEARTAVEKMIEIILNQIPSPNPNAEYDNNWTLIPETLSLFNDEHHEVDTTRDAGYEDFFAFLRLLRRAMREASEQGRCFFFVAPQP